MTLLDFLNMDVERTTFQRFVAFHEANPQVYENLEGLARGLHDAGRQRIGMKMLFEVVRWQHYMMTSDPSSEFKLNNNYTAHYARLLMSRNSGWENLFETRHLKEGDW